MIQHQEGEIIGSLRKIRLDLKTLLIEALGLLPIALILLEIPQQKVASADRSDYRESLSDEFAMAASIVPLAICTCASITNGVASDLIQIGGFLQGRLRRIDLLLTQQELGLKDVERHWH